MGMHNIIQVHDNVIWDWQYYVTIIHNESGKYFT